MNTCILGINVIKWLGQYYRVSEVNIINDEITYKVEPSNSAFEAALLTNIKSGLIRQPKLYFSCGEYTWFADDATKGEA